MLFSKLVICSDIRFLFDLNAGDANTDFSYFFAFQYLFSE